MEVHSHAIDLSEPGATKTLVLHTEQRSLCIVCLVNNAGFGMVDEHVVINPNYLHRMLQLNVVAVAELCQAYGALMKQRGDGRILNIASTAAFQPTPYFAAYVASKSFVLSFSEAFGRPSWQQRSVMIALRYLISKELSMKAAAAQIAFRYRSQDSATGVTRTTAKRLAELLGVDETQVIHLALHELATKFLPQYEADEGGLTKAQLNQVRKSAPKAKGGTVRSSLFASENP